MIIVALFILCLGLSLGNTIICPSLNTIQMEEAVTIFAGPYCTGPFYASNTNKTGSSTRLQNIFQKAGSFR